MQTARKLSPADCADRKKAESCSSSRQNCCAKFYGEKGSAEKYYIKGCLSTKGCHSFELNSKCDFEIANCTAVKVICAMVLHRNTNGQRCDDHPDHDRMQFSCPFSLRRDNSNQEFKFR